MTSDRPRIYNYYYYKSGLFEGHQVIPSCIYFIEVQEETNITINLNMDRETLEKESRIYAKKNKNKFTQELRQKR